MAKNSSSQ
jgi:hypothetical protein